jgi:thymidylate kinase
VASTLAYQAAQGLDREMLRERMAEGGFPEPDLVLWLRLPVARALERLGGDAIERFERRDFLERVDREYQALGLLELPAGGTVDEVAAELQARVTSVLNGC